jgi:hypothetical protein
MKDEGNIQMDAALSAERREFLKNLSLTTAALVVGGCTSNSQVTPKDAALKPSVPSGPPTPPVNLPPTWLTVPTITFTQGVRATFSIAGYVSDPNGDPLSITKNSAVLPPGVTYDIPSKSFIYDGVGAPASTSGHILTANDGKP